MEEADTKKEKADSNPNVIDGNRKSLRRPKVLPYDDDDSSSRKSEKPKHEKSNKHENKKEKRGNCLMTYLICFLILFGQVAFSRVSGEIIETNRIKKGDLNPLQQNASSEERITKRHINDEAFRAYYCEDDEKVATAEYSLNPPKECNRADGSAYFPPTPSKGQILQEVRRLPVETSICKVEWRVTIGWCGGEYVAMNYMHANIQTMRTFILPTDIQCHNALPDQTLEITVLLLAKFIFQGKSVHTT